MCSHFSGQAFELGPVVTPAGILPLVSMGGTSFVTINPGPRLQRMTPVGVRNCRRLTTCVSLALGHETPGPGLDGERVIGADAGLDRVSARTHGLPPVLLCHLRLEAT